MKAVVILCAAILALATFPTTGGYEFFYPYGYIDPMMRSGYNSASIPSSRLLFPPLTNFFFKGCPSTVIGGQVVGNICFTVTTTPTTFAAAQLACTGSGGTLAQPAPLPSLSTTFYAALKARFPTQFATVEAANPGKFWIGYQQNAINGALFAMDRTFRQVQIVAPTIFLPLPGLQAAGAPLLAAAIVTPGTTWQALDPITPLPFICQYSLV